MEIKKRKKNEELVHQMSAAEIVKVTIESRMIYDGPRPVAGTELEQWLTILRDGQTTIKHHYASESTVKIEEWNFDIIIVIPLFSLQWKKKT